MSVSVVVPWGGDCEHRARARDWVLARYRAEFPGWQLVVAGWSGDGWSKGAAVAGALEVVTGDVLVVSDGDVWCPSIGPAVAAVLAGEPWAVPHRKVRRIDEASTAAVLTGAEFDVGMPLARQAYSGVTGGGAVVLRRDLYEQAPIDPRFVGWGGEDQAWGYALTGLVGFGPARFERPCWHLWHPPQVPALRVSPASNQLRARYQRAMKTPRLLPALLGEARREVANVDRSAVHPVVHDHAPAHAGA